MMSEGQNRLLPHNLFDTTPLFPAPSSFPFPSDAMQASGRGENNNRSAPVSTGSSASASGVLPTSGLSRTVRWTNVDVVAMRHRDPYSAEVAEQLRHGTCPVLDSLLRTFTSLEHKDQLLVLSATGSLAMKEQKKKRVVSTMRDLVEAIIGEYKMLESPLLKDDRIVFLEMLCEFSYMFDATFAIQYARSVMAERLRDTSAESSEQERMLSPIHADAKSAAADAFQRRGGSRAVGALTSDRDAGGHGASSSSRQGGGRWRPACRDWNINQCTRETCKFEHKCTQCGESGKQQGHVGCPNGNRGNTNATKSKVAGGDA